MEDDEIVSHKIPARNKKKSQHPHSLAAAVAANRAAEKNHESLSMFNKYIDITLN